MEVIRIIKQKLDEQGELNRQREKIAKIRKTAQNPGAISPFEPPTGQGRNRII